MCVTLEIQLNNHVPVFTWPMITLAESIVGNKNDEALLQGLPDTKAKDTLVDMKNALICDPRRFVLRKIHLSNTTTTFVGVPDLPRLPHSSILDAHEFSSPTPDWLHRELVRLYRDEHRRSPLLDGRHDPSSNRISVAPLSDYLCFVSLASLLSS